VSDPVEGSTLFANAKALWKVGLRSSRVMVPGSVVGSKPVQVTVIIVDDTGLFGTFIVMVAATRGARSARNPRLKCIVD